MLKYTMPIIHILYFTASINLFRSFLITYPVHKMFRRIREIVGLLIYRGNDII